MRSRGHLLVDLLRLQDNVRQLQKRVPRGEILFMVKANAYGHGMSKIVDYCFRRLGITSFGLASLGEGLALRRAFCEYGYELIIFSDGSIAEHLDDYLDFKIIPVLSRMDDLMVVLNEGKCRHLPLCLKFDTGMNRLGLSPDRVSTVADELRKRGRSIYHLMTHLSDSFLPESPKTARQCRLFSQIKKAFADAGIEVNKTSIANSAAIENGVGLEETVIRPGLMLYGPRATVGKPGLWGGQIISSLMAEVLDVRPIAEGATVGYGSAPVGQDGKLCILGLGYGDGLNNSYRGLNIHVDGFSGEIAGRVNMDMMQVLFPKQTPIRRGGLIPLWQHSPEQFMAVVNHTGLNPYEVTTLLQERVPRVYKGG